MRLATSKHQSVVAVPFLYAKISLGAKHGDLKSFPSKTF